MSNAKYNCKMVSTWQTLDDFNAQSGVSCWGYGLWSDSSGNIYAGAASGNSAPDAALIRRLQAGSSTWTQLDSYTLSGATYHYAIFGLTSLLGNHFMAMRTWMSAGVSPVWRTRRSTDNGATWTTVDNYLGADIAGTTGAWTQSIYEDPSTGKIFVGGIVYDGVANHGIVRVSSDQGNTWSRVEDLQLATNKATIVLSNFLKDSSGNLYWGGCGIQATNYQGLIRKSTDGGQTWSTFRIEPTPSGATELCYKGLYIDANGVFYAFGQTLVSGYHAVVYRSTDQGQTWTMVDDYQLASGKNTFPDNHGIPYAVDKNGTMYFLFYAIDSSNIYHRMVRKSSDGLNWSISEDYRLTPSGNSGASEIVRDAMGNILTNGWAYDSSGTSHCVIRKLACVP